MSCSKECLLTILKSRSFDKDEITRLVQSNLGAEKFNIVHGTFLIAGSYPDMLLNNVQKAKDIDLWTCRKNAFKGLTPNYVDEYDKSQMETFRTGRINAIYYQRMEKINGQMVVVNFTSSVTRSVIEYEKELDMYILHEESVSGRTTQIPLPIYESLTKCYPEKHYNNVSPPGCIRPNKLFDLAYLALREIHPLLGNNTIYEEEDLDFLIPTHPNNETD